ncbi:DUF6518 family protein [Kitasatospora paracochleata]|uniref:Uncharacterized protein n=1 Tax=Kitasatospora paracochleata TaxID=58354 RepID=A0ABT1IXU4_9ACTN|nr:DUF6518 family protein [Kitasatospora paracochleata]MCP2309967.1 hypothetical protein [Kitasatospora paracochleata]
MMRRLAALAVSALGGGLFGWAVSLLPSPTRPHVFWVGNYAAPWLALAFAAGWAQGGGRRRWAVPAGVVTDVVCVTAFYGHFLFVDQHPGPLGRGSALGSRVAENLPGWLLLAAPWLALAVAAGTLYGLLGHWWARRRALPAGAALAAACLLEPWAWRAAGYTAGPWLPWLAELAAGAVLLAAFALTARRSGTADRADSDRTGPGRTAAALD